MANQFSVGDLEVLAVSDGEAILTPDYFRGVTDEQWAPHRRWLDHDGRMRLPLGAFVVRSGDVRVLIDSGTGRMENERFVGGRLLEDMASAGARPEDIDVVFITHLHFDHVGWLAHEEGNGGLQPTFPRASYRWTSTDQDAFSKYPQSAFVRHDLFGAVASRWQPADGGASLAPGVNVMAMPGHTPGHAGVVLSSGDARAFLLGDAISCPVQLEEPEWSGMGDVDPQLARRTQEAVLREIEGGGATFGASHFPGLQFGRVLRGEGKRYWEAI